VNYIVPGVPKISITPLPSLDSPPTTNLKSSVAIQLTFSIVFVLPSHAILISVTTPPSGLSLKIFNTPIREEVKKRSSHKNCLRVPFNRRTMIQREQHLHGDHRAFCCSNCDGFVDRETTPAFLFLRSRMLLPSQSYKNSPICCPNCVDT